MISDWAGTAGEPAERMLAGLSFLDLYAGSGAVALEAASRGAAPVRAIEHDRATADLARGNARLTGLEVTMVTARVERLVSAPAPLSYDIVWADPPYALPAAAVDAVLRDLVGHGWLAEGGLVVVERSSRDKPVSWPESVLERGIRSYGETTLYFATKGDI